MRYFVLFPLLLAGCGGSAKPEATSYLTLASDCTVQGWDAFKALDVQLPRAEHARITTAAPIGMGPRFFVALRGSCADNAALVDHARAIVAAKGVAIVTCGAASPDH